MPIQQGFSPLLMDSPSRGIIGSTMLSLSPPILLLLNWCWVSGTFLMHGPLVLHSGYSLYLLMPSMSKRTES